MNLKNKDLKIIFNKKNIKKNINITSSTINSKEVKKGSIFFAIKGKKTDGHFYIKEVLRKKSEMIVVKKNFKLPKHNRDKFIKVSSPLKYLNKIASYIRKKNNSIFIGITGSYGKTTLKSMLQFFLSNFKKTYSSPKSFNNHFGLPLSLSNTPQNSKYNIFELGMSHKGEINKLSKILLPNIAIITNIGPAHLKNFKNLKEICYAKAEILNHVTKNGVVFLNKDDFYFKTLLQIAKRKKIKTITFGNSLGANVQIIKKTINNKKNFLKLKIFENKYTVQVKNFNDNFIQNFLITLGVLAYLNLDLDFALKLSKNFAIPSGRGNLIQKKYRNKKISIIDESYNANPITMNNAINNFCKMKIKKEKKVIIGDMLELGFKSKFYHQQLANSLNSKSIKKVYLVGKEVISTYNRLKKRKNCYLYNNVNTLRDKLSEILDTNSVYLVKGSNSIGLNELLSNNFN